MVDFTVANVALSWASSVHAQPLSWGLPSVPSTDDQPLCAGAEHHEAPGCWREDLQMPHMEEATKRNLHSGHMVYMMALMEMGVGAGVRTVWSASQGHPCLVQAGGGGPLRGWAHVHSGGHVVTPGRRG